MRKAIDGVDHEDEVSHAATGSNWKPLGACQRSSKNSNSPPTSRCPYIALAYHTDSYFGDDEHPDGLVVLDAPVDGVQPAPRRSGRSPNGHGDYRQVGREDPDERGCGGQADSGLGSERTEPGLEGGESALSSESFLNMPDQRRMSANGLWRLWSPCFNMTRLTMSTLQKRH